MKLAGSVLGLPRAVWTLTGVVALCCVVGCSKGSSCSLSGQVTLGGEPVENGNVVFRPVESTPGPAAAAKVIAGKYDVPVDKGLLAGKYRVEITATRENVQYIPDVYNVASELKVDVSPGQNTEDFALELGEVTTEEMVGQDEKLPTDPDAP